MFKSFPNMLNRKKRKEENIENFGNYLDDIKQEFVVLNKLIEDYNLDATEALIPQIERYLGRSLETDEKQTIEFAVKANRDSGHPKERRFDGKAAHTYRRSKKKKKK
jgi:hypothetical protein